MPRVTEAARDVCARCGRGVRADLLADCLCWDCSPSWAGPTRQRTRCPLCERRYGLDGHPCIRCQVIDGAQWLALADWIAETAEGRDAGPFPPEPITFARMSEAERAAWVRRRVREVLTRKAQRERAAQVAEAVAPARPSWRARLWGGS
jgi:hypothetical protein